MTPAATLSEPRHDGAAHQPETACQHCGEPCGRTPVRGRSGTFCCTGCEAVHGLLEAHGLAAYYSCEVRAGVSLKSAGARDPDRFAALNDPEVAARLAVPAGPGRAIVTFAVPAMHCGSCIWLLEQLWRFAHGVTRAEANLMRRTVRVEFRPAATSLSAIALALASLGYEPVVDAERDCSAPPRLRRRLYLQLGVAGFAFGNIMLFSIPQYANGAPLEPALQRLFNALNLAFALPVLLYSGADYFRGAWAAARVRTVTLDVPIAIGLAALFGRSLYEVVTMTGEGFFDSFAGLAFFLLIGKLFQQYAFDGIAFDRSVRSFLPLSVAVVCDDRVILRPIERLAPGDVMAVRPQEVVPADAVLLTDTGLIDYAFVTGEQAPVGLRAGEVVIAGGRVVGRGLRLAVARPVDQGRLAALWADPVFARSKPHQLTAWLAQFGRWFTFVSVGLAAAGAAAWWPDVGMAVSVATAVLIIACPCALTLAAPLALGTAMGVLGRRGIFLKQPAVALDLAGSQVVLFDKTGTLTTTAEETTATRTGLNASDWTRVGDLAAQSVHPVSRALARNASGTARVETLSEEPGRGICGVVDGHRVAIGTAAFVATVVGRPVASASGSTHVAVDDRIGFAHVTAREREGALEAAAAIGVGRETWLLSGDHGGDTDHWSRVFGPRLLFRQSPEEKLAVVRAHQARGATVLMIGDGLNDAGALAAADVGLAISDDTACLVPACDGLVRGDQLRRLPAVLEYSRRARRVIALCFAVSVAYNVLGLWLALAGRLTPLATAILMPISSLTIIGLSVGLMRWRAGTVLDR